MRAWCLLVVLALCGCPVPEESFDAGTLPDGGACPVELVIGTEDLEASPRAFRPLTDGGTLEIIAGPQGGWHVWVSVRSTGRAPTGVLRWALRGDGATLTRGATQDLAQLGVERISCGWEQRMTGLPFDASGEPWRGRTAVLEASWEPAFGVAPVVVRSAVQLE